MKYMLDTNICICAIKQKPKLVIANMMAHNPNDICISSITYAELMHGVEKSQAVEKNRLALTLFLSAIEIWEFHASAAEAYGKIRADLEKQGTPHRPSGPADRRPRQIGRMCSGDESYSGVSEGGGAEG